MESEDRENVKHSTIEMLGLNNAKINPHRL